ncbi:MAG: glutamyl-tRNA reductase [Clostridiales bacterium]|uniref:glutamyl-tRNA reductase n=1 Tax=Clostridium sp. N3C TaxID=1776758 RepID=UPI00092DF2AE|nr:glutamyl-tRNA reductase [Clostridium sp. N3C]NLZ49905.1 glutamyl-tRNA reductase [Clostridiales bacterium]SCN26126.1 Glutamyl-tRNA reductase [Clostridium sp. N3C]
MLGLIGIRANVNIEIREGFSLSLSKLDKALNKLRHVFEEVVILSTCNRTEIYFVANINEDEALELIFQNLEWNSNLKEYFFVVKEKKAVEHIMKVACGFHSKILGEDQILGQIKDAFDKAVNFNCVKGELQKLFQKAISCGKEFRTACKLYKIPVSASSIAVKDCIQNKIKSLMIIGYGDIGKLALKYALDGRFIEKIYLVVRNIKKYENEELIINNPKVKLLTFCQKNKYYQKVEAIISCTSAPHPVVKVAEFKDMDLSKPLVIYDLAVPRDVEEGIKGILNIKLYDIDNLNTINEENKNKRKKVMYENLNIIDKNIEDYMAWKKLREITPEIVKLKESSHRVFQERYKVFINKQHSKPTELLAKKLIKSASEVYINRAIELLKEEKLKGRENECLRILERIFLV